MRANSSGAGIRPVFWLLILVPLLAAVTGVVLSRREKAALTETIAPPLDNATSLASDNTIASPGSRGEAATTFATSQGDGLRLIAGDTEIVLPGGWQRLTQPESFFVQARAVNQVRGIALSAGAFSIDLPFEHYVALGLAGVMTGPEVQLDRIAQLLQVPRGELDATMQSQIGRQTMEQMKQKGSVLTDFELLASTRTNIAGDVAFEIRSKASVRESGQVIYSRQFAFRGSTPREIVQVTYASPSDDIFQDRELLGAIRRPSSGNLAGAARNDQSATPNVEDNSSVIQVATDYFLTGMGKGQRRDFRGAVADFSKAIELKPDFAEAYNARGLAKGALAGSPGDAVRTLADYNRAIELKPDYAEAYYNRGVAKQVAGDKAGALADQSKAIELRPDYAQAYFNRGMVKAASRDLSGAMVDYNKAIELKPDYALAYEARSKLKKVKGDLVGAQADFKKAAELRQP